MFRATLAVLLGGYLLAAASGGAIEPRDLSRAPSEDLLHVYADLRQLRAGDQWALTENVVWKRDAATFTFVDGHLIFAAPVEGRVLAAVFAGRGTFALIPPTGMDRHQIARFTKADKLEEGFREAVFFFTDNSWEELTKLVKIQSAGDPGAAGKLLESVQKKYIEDYNDWWSNESKGNPEMHNLAARMLADLSDPSSRGFFLADLKTDHHDDLLYQISWNRDPLLLPGLDTDEEIMLVHHKRNQYYEWWAGFHVGEEYAHSPHPEHRALLAHCRQQTIEAEISKDNHLSATAEMEFEVPRGSPRILPLTLRGVLRISDVTDGAGKKLRFIQEDRKLDNDPWVILPEPPKPGQTYKMKITYEEDSTRDSRIINQRGQGLYYVTSRESWFPSFGAFDDRTRYVVRFRSPKKFQFVGTGRLIKSEKSKDSLETEWQSEIPYSVVGFNYGDFVDKSQSDSNLTVTAYAGKEIPDELKGLQSAIDTAELAGGSGGSRNIAGQMGIATGGFNTAANVGHAAGMSFQAFKLFEFYFGQLPFKTISVTEQPVRGYGQSWPTLIFLPYDSLLDSTTRQGLKLQESADAREFYNIVAVHEMAHQWWGHLVGWKTYHDAWLSEGFAEFSAALYLMKVEPKKLRSFWNLKRDRLFQKDAAGHRPVDVGPLWLSLQLPAYLEPELYDRLVYFKGAYVLEMLRALLEDPRLPNPDTRFIAMMRDFVSTYAGKNASTEDFRRVVEKHFGESMDWFFNEWVYGTEIPHYDFSYQLKSEGAGKTLLHVSLSQSGVSDSFTMRVPVYAVLNGQTRRLGFLSIRGTTTFTADIPLSFQPEKVYLDEYHSILCTIKQ